MFIFVAKNVSPMKGQENREPLRGNHWWSRVWYFYIDGFRAMTLGRTLWLIIGIKLVVFFVILRFIFFPNYLNQKASTEEGKAQYVREQLTKRTAPPASQPVEQNNKKR